MKTWEEKLKEIAQDNSVRCNFDIKGGFAGRLERLEAAVKSGDLSVVKYELKEIAPIWERFQLLIKHLQKGVKLGIVTWSSNQTAYAEVEVPCGGKWVIGAVRRNGVSRMITPAFLLYLHRLMRDAEKRALAHPCNKIL
jgi:hypothetical protein